MARSSEIAAGTYSSALASGVSSAYLQNMGQGIAFVVLATSTPTADVGNVGFRLHNDEGFSISGLDGTKNLYVGALNKAVSIEYETT